MEVHREKRRRIESGADRWYHRDCESRQWLHLFGEGFAEHGWPLSEVPELKPLSKWMTLKWATALLIREVPWCAERALEWERRDGFANEDWFTKIYCRCPAEAIVDKLGIEVAVQLELMSSIASDVGDLLDRTDVPNRLTFIEKIRRSYWHASCYSGRMGEGESPGYQRMFYNRIAGILDGIRRFEFGIVGSSIGEYTTYADTAATMRWGHGVVNRNHYGDAHLSLNVCRGDQHVLSIGFSPTEYGIAVCQVQVKQRTGNRWLFSLGEHFLDYALERMHAAFPEEPLLLVSGESAAGFVAANYQASARPEQAVLQRVKDLYSRPLTRWRRKAEAIPMNFIGQREFYGLVREK